jgi:hypothetical protein
VGFVRPDENQVVWMMRMQKKGYAAHLPEVNGKCPWIS